ncbi:MAG: DUF1152 domain-containing protein [Thermoleophilaceae bacterium]|nr:DUF1152 domain-containing protein [Thermoleophilaceae bacterium]
MADAEAMLTSARRPLVVGIGGGGDVVGALATAEACRIYHGAEFVVGGVTWERRPIDPQPGPRRLEEAQGVEQIAPGVALAGPDAGVPDAGVTFAEGHMARFLGERTLLVDPNGGPAAVADALGAAADALGCDLVVLLDVGGDALAHGGEPGLGSPLCDALLIAAGARAQALGLPVLGAIFGAGCDGELTPGEVLERVSEVAAAGGLAGVRGLTEPVAARLEQAVRAVPTEASAQALRCFRGERGDATIRGGARRVELSPLGATTFYFDLERALGSAARLARAVHDAASLEHANDLLHELGVRTELDLERELAAAGR